MINLLTTEMYRQAAGWRDRGSPSTRWRQQLGVAGDAQIVPLRLLRFFTLMIFKSSEPPFHLREFHREGALSRNNDRLPLHSFYHAKTSMKRWILLGFTVPAAGMSGDAVRKDRILSIASSPAPSNRRDSP
jgi:hypothetical protein